MLKGIGSVSRQDSLQLTAGGVACSGAAKPLEAETGGGRRRALLMLLNGPHPHHAIVKL